MITSFNPDCIEILPNLESLPIGDYRSERIHLLLGVATFVSIDRSTPTRNLLKKCVAVISSKLLGESGSDARRDSWDYAGRVCFEWITGGFKTVETDELLEVYLRLMPNNDDIFKEVHEYYLVREPQRRVRAQQRRVREQQRRVRERRDADDGASIPKRKKIMLNCK